MSPGRNDDRNVPITTAKGGPPVRDPDASAGWRNVSVTTVVAPALRTYGSVTMTPTGGRVQAW